LSEQCGKARKEVLNQLKMLRGALKVLPRYFKSAPLFTPVPPSVIECMINPYQSGCQGGNGA
jgi:hypothetical protein